MPPQLAAVLPPLLPPPPSQPQPQPLPVARCLFGLPAPGEARRFADEAFAEEWRRFASQWGVDASLAAEGDGDNGTAGEGGAANNLDKGTKTLVKIPFCSSSSPGSSRRRSFDRAASWKPYPKQMQLKDFFVCRRRVNSAAKPET